MIYDLLIQGGQVIDPAHGLNAVRDIAIKDGRIAAVESRSAPRRRSRSSAHAESW